MDAARTSPLNGRMSRRRLLGGLAASTAAACFGRAGVESAYQEASPGVEETRTVFQTHGFHAAPDRGGGQRIDLQIADMQTLAATSVTVILPTEEYLEKAVDARLFVATRLHFNNFDDIPSVLERQLAIHKGRQRPIFQVGNEIDQEGFGGSGHLTRTIQSRGFPARRESNTGYGGDDTHPADGTRLTD